MRKHSNYPTYSNVDLIKHEVSIVEVLEQYTDADFSRSNPNKSRLQIRCPFHDDRNPSFTVYVDTNTFRCWSGCNEGRPGDVINVVQLAYNTDFKEAIRILKSDFGLEEPTGEQAEKWQQKRAERKKEAALKKKMKFEIDENFHALVQVKWIILDKLSSIQTADDLDAMGELYHLLPQIEYWLDCLTDSDAAAQIGALKEVEHFIQSIHKEV